MACAGGDGDPGGVAVPERARTQRRGYLLPGLIALAVLLAIGLVFGAGDLDHRSLATLDGSDAARTISFGIEAETGSRSPPDVVCPGSEPVRAGWTFTCTIESRGRSIAVDVTEIDSHGGLRWSIAGGS